MLPTPNRVRTSNRGQSLVELVVSLPILLMLVIGLDYFFQITAARSRAIEAARVSSWESAWYLRDKGQGTINAPPNNLNARLTSLFIDRFLVDSNGLIRWVNLTENIAVRARPAQVLEAFEQASQSAPH